VRPMNKTNTKTLRGSALKQLCASCKHANVISLSDGVAVCTACEAVLR
jgi:ribosomal protein L37AE/L43A